MAQAAQAQTTAPQGKIVPVGSPVHGEITQFLYEEAYTLDHRDFGAWTAMLAKDLVYTAPLRTTRTGPARDDDIIYGSTGHFDDDYNSIMGRLGRLSTKSAWAEDPPSRTRRLITNVLVRETPTPGEFAVVSAFLMTRNRYENAHSTTMSGERRDLLRRVEGGFEIARREIIFDQSVLGMSNLAVFF